MESIQRMADQLLQLWNAEDLFALYADRGDLEAADEMVEVIATLRAELGVVATAYTSMVAMLVLQ